jgi:hypothetical protein
MLALLLHRSFAQHRNHFLLAVVVQVLLEARIHPVNSNNRPSNRANNLKLDLYNLSSEPPEL